MAADTLEILVATDVHIGYAEKDPVRREDSINTFEEVLQIAQKRNVDLVLLGGDLFHESKPSRYCLYRCMELLRRYCLNDRPVSFQMVSENKVNFGHSAFDHVNYEDANLNVGLPVFTIHGNHDDVGGNGLGAMDLLHVSGLVNYFGKNTTLDKVSISPLLLRKGSTTVALYGLGAVKDDRLHRLFLEHKVTFSTLNDERASSSCFSLMVIHQNRVRHNVCNWIPENLLPDFLDLVIWGHEHPCLIDPEWRDRFYVMQPGSTVATSLCEGEAGDKYVALLRIRGKEFKTEKIKLETVRPFYFEEVSLKDIGFNPEEVDCASKVETYCAEKVEGYINEAEAERQRSSTRPGLPLIRLRIDLTGGFESFASHRFAQKFVDRVADPAGILSFHRKRELLDAVTPVDAAVIEAVVQHEAEDMMCRVEDMVKKYFASVSDDMRPRLITETGVVEAVKQFVDKDERDAFSLVVQYQLRKQQQMLKKEQVRNEHQIYSAILSQWKQRNAENAAKEVQQIINENRDTSKGKGTEDRSSSPELDFLDDEADEGPSASLPKSQGRGRGRGRSRARGRGKSAVRQSVSSNTRFEAATTMDAFLRGKSLAKKHKSSINDDDDGMLMEEVGSVSMQSAAERKRKHTAAEQCLENDGSLKTYYSTRSSRSRLAPSQNDVASDDFDIEMDAE